MGGWSMLRIGVGKKCTTVVVWWGMAANGAA